MGIHLCLRYEVAVHVDKKKVSNKNMHFTHILRMKFYYEHMSPLMLT